MATHRPGRKYQWGLFILLILGGFVITVLRTRAGTYASTLGQPFTSPDTVVLTGSYSCDVLVQTLVSSDPQEPVVVRETSEAISLSGTGSLAPITPRAGAPSFGGEPGGRIETVDLGSGVGVGFEGGTLDDCVRFGNAVAAVATGLGCDISPLRTRRGVSILPDHTAFSLVCEGPEPNELHAIAELDRAVLDQRLSTSE